MVVIVVVAVAVAVAVPAPAAAVVVVVTAVVRPTSVDGEQNLKDRHIAFRYRVNSM